MGQMTDSATVYLRGVYEKYSINKLKRKLGVMYGLQAWEGVKLIKSIILEKRNLVKSTI